MLTTYQEIRDRICQLARLHGLRVDWTETTRLARLVLLYDRSQVVVGRAVVPVREIRATALVNLERALEHVFGKDWLQ